jgi:hypothetical protein
METSQRKFYSQTRLVGRHLDDAYSLAAPSLFPLVDGDAYRLDDKHRLG